jgi:hypothetical protein
MKRLLSLSKMLLATAALTALVTSAVNAGGINLSWTDCGTFGQMQRNSTCATNTGANTMVGSAISPNVIPQCVAMSAVLDLQTNQAALTPWWGFGTGGCRSGPPSALSPSFDFTTSTFSCGDPWGGVAAGGSDYATGGGGPNRARIRLVCAVAAPIVVDNSSENYYFKVTYNMSKTTGTGACAGCTDGACIVFNSIELDQQPGLGNTEITNPIDRNFVIWQAGGSVAGGCPQAVPTRNSTWGSVKSLYR